MESVKACTNLGIILNDRHPKHHCCDPILQICPPNIHRIRSFLTKGATQLLVQALVISHLDYSNSLLAIAAYLERCSMLHIQSTQILTCDSPPP